MNAMLVSSAAPNNLWGEALLSACFLQNRIPHKKTQKTPYELWKGFVPNLNYLKVWGCLAKVLLPDFKKRKIGSKTSDCLFIGYAQQSVAYRFLVLKSDILDRNTIVETKDAEFFENVYPLKVEYIPKRIENNVSSFEQNSNEDSFVNLRRSKRQRKETSFGDDFYTYLVENEPKNFYEAISSPEAKCWKEAIQAELDSLSQNKT